MPYVLDKARVINPINTNVQTDLNLCMAHMPEGMFSDIVAYSFEAYADIEGPAQSARIQGLINLFTVVL